MIYDLEHSTTTGAVTIAVPGAPVGAYEAIPVGTNFFTLQMGFLGETEGPSLTPSQLEGLLQQEADVQATIAQMIQKGDVATLVAPGAGLDPQSQAEIAAALVTYVPQSVPPNSALSGDIPPAGYVPADVQTFYNEIIGGANILPIEQQAIAPNDLPDLLAALANTNDIVNVTIGNNPPPPPPATVDLSLAAINSLLNGDGVGGNQISAFDAYLATFRRKIEVFGNSDTDGRCRQCRTKETTSPGAAGEVVKE
jgi:hypothetical protein